MQEPFLVRSPRERSLVVRENLISLTGDFKEAVLLSLLAEWMHHEWREQKILKRTNAEREDDGRAPLHTNPELWVRRTSEEIMSDAIGLFEGEEEVYRTAERLAEKGLVRIGRPFKRRGDRRRYLRANLQAVNRELRKGVSRSATWDKRFERSAERSAEERANRDGYVKGDWQYDWAAWWWTQMDRLGNGRITKTQRQDKEDTLQGWAEAFAYCIRVRGYTKKELSQVMRWLFQWDDWWIDEAAIRSPGKFRNRNRDGEWVIDQLYSKSEVVKNNLMDDLPAPDEEPIAEWQVERLEEKLPRVRKYLKSAGYGTGRDSDQKVYRLKDGVDKEEVVMNA